MISDEEIRELRADGFSRAKLMAELGLSKHRIDKACDGMHRARVVSKDCADHLADLRTLSGRAAYINEPAAIRERRMRMSAQHTFSLTGSSADLCSAA